MEKEFLDYYRDNLSYFRKLSSEFASEFPKIAARLDINNLECQDPFVERLLEGTAFLTARIEKKLDEGYPRFLNSVLQSVCPLALSPIPAFTNVKVDSTAFSKIGDKSLTIPYGTTFKRSVNKNKSVVTLQNLIETKIHPVNVKNTELVSHDFMLSSLNEFGYNNAFKLTLESMQGASFSSMELDNLDLYLNLGEDDASKLCELILCNTFGVYLKRKDGSFSKLDGIEVELTFIDEKSNALNEARAIVNGLSAVYLYMSNPDCFKYIRVKGLSKALQYVNEMEVELYFLLDRDYEPALDSKILPSSVQANIIPLVNLFPMRSNRILFNQDYEVNLNVDSTNPLDYEIYSVSKLEFFDSSNHSIFNAYPFFASNIKAATQESTQNFFSVNRRFRQAGLNATNRTPYKKSEAFISVSGSDFTEHMSESLQFSAECSCTNADLCLFLNTGDSLICRSMESLGEVTIISKITRPKAPLVTGNSSDDFKKMSYVLLNLSSMLTGSNESALYTLKQIVRAFSTMSVSETSKLVGSIVNLEIKPKVFRSLSKGCVYYENGFNLDITFAEKRLEGVGLFTFSKVVSKLLFDYCPMNTPMSIDIYSDVRGHVYSCKTLKE